MLTTLGTGVPVASKSSASIQNEFAGRSAGVKAITVKEKLFVQRVCGVVLSAQTRVPVCDVPLIYPPAGAFCVTVVVVPLLLTVGVTVAPSTCNTIEPPTTVVVPSSRTI